MKNLPYFFLAALILVGGFVTYSRQQKVELTAITPLQSQQETPDTIQTHRATLPVKDPLVLYRETKKILNKYNLSQLWMSYYLDRDAEMWFAEPEVVKAEEAVEPVYKVKDSDSIGNTTIDTTKEEIHTEAVEEHLYLNSPPAIYDGFYGTNRYQIEMYFASVTKDAKRPNVYHVTGKSRFKKNITPFLGEIVLNEVQTLDDPSMSTEERKYRKISHLYDASGTFEFRQNSAYPNAGIFKGHLYVNFAIFKNKTSQSWLFYETDKTRGSGFLFDGDWTSYKTGKGKPFLLPGYLRPLGNQILEDFDLGGRGVQINPKYRKLGWENYWENEEWWDEPTKPIL